MTDIADGDQVGSMTDHDGIATSADSEHMTTGWRRTGGHSGRPWSRRLRMLAGVREELLDLVPHERARYTALGGVVLGTATIATFSMWAGLNEVLGTVSVACLVPALIWGLFVLNLDRWLVSSSTGTQWGHRLVLLLGRLALAAVFGVIIAEPLVLRIFQTAIEQHVQDGRADDLRVLGSTYVRCNPIPGSPESQQPLATDCAQYHLSLGADPGGVAGRLTGLQGQADTLQSTIDTETTQLSQLTTDANNECSGAFGPGYTGKVGYGRQCLDRRAAVAQYADTHPIGEQQQQLTSLRDTIAGLRGPLADQQNSFVAARTALINQKVAERAAHQGSIGLLERFQALDELTSANGFVNGAKWALTIFFVLVDCLPVLGKLLGGITGYDRLVDRSARRAEFVFELTNKKLEAEAVAELDADQYGIGARLRKIKAAADLDLVRHEAEMSSRMDEQIEHIATQTLREMRGHRNGTRVDVSMPTTQLNV